MMNIEGCCISLWRYGQKCEKALPVLLIEKMEYACIVRYVLYEFAGTEVYAI